jgi:hypothetical protein
MADREQPYDPYIPAAGAGGQQGAQGQNGNHRTAALQAVCQTISPVDSALSQQLPLGRSAVAVQRWPRPAHRLHQRCPSWARRSIPPALPGALRSAATLCSCTHEFFRMREPMY